MGHTGRSKGYRITLAQRLALGQKLRELLRVTPDMSIADLVKRTGAPYDMCNFMRKRVKEEVARDAHNAQVAREDAAEEGNAYSDFLVDPIHSGA